MRKFVKYLLIALASPFLAILAALMFCIAIINSACHLCGSVVDWAFGTRSFLYEYAERCVASENPLYLKRWLS